MTKGDVMDINTEAVDEAVPEALNLCNQSRAYEPAARDGFILEPINRAKSVVLTDEG
ncbi:MULTISPECIES: hypothetical protein [unclassified Cupriavidus]|uniref:hypothetical protein n=1 Tax=unclassified Cupriavidus TaxID=2640874 RepID=UPI0003A83224|nr:MULTISPECIES: hypothetical protein [unclassified Cupriavidus]UIF89155.1 hypothetical protein KAF44_27240 [Cupriavidus necator]UIF89494.1 hypothetical protein KAF44_29305 [Cupriavidus necator]